MVGFLEVLGPEHRSLMEQLLPSPGLCSLMSGAGEVWRDSQVSSCTPWTGLQSWFLWPNPVLGKAAQLPQLPTLLKNSCNTLGMWTKLTEGAMGSMKPL